MDNLRFLLPRMFPALLATQRGPLIWRQHYYEGTDLRVSDEVYEPYYRAMAEVDEDTIQRSFDVAMRTLRLGQQRGLRPVVLVTPLNPGAIHDEAARARAVELNQRVRDWIRSENLVGWELDEVPLEAGDFADWCHLVSTEKIDAWTAALARRIRESD